MTGATRPTPTPDAITAPFWEGCRRHELRIQQCEVCRFRWLPAAVVCPRCWSDTVTWTASAGEGTVVSFAVYHRSYHAAFAPLVPYVVAVVELAEGPRLISNIVDTPPERIAVGAPVRVEWAPVGEAVLPVFRPAGGSAS